MRKMKNILLHPNTALPSSQGFLEQQPTMMSRLKRFGELEVGRLFSVADYKHQHFTFRLVKVSPNTAIQLHYKGMPYEPIMDQFEKQFLLASDDAVVLLNADIF